MHTSASRMLLLGVLDMEKRAQSQEFLGHFHIKVSWLFLACRKCDWVSIHSGMWKLWILGWFLLI
jgi:hypothetical protein